MDANIVLDDSEFLARMLAKRWTNVASGFPDAKAPTYGKDNDWDRRAKGHGIARI